MKLGKMIASLLSCDKAALVQPWHDVKCPMRLRLDGLKIVDELNSHRGKYDELAVSVMRFDHLPMDGVLTVQGLANMLAEAVGQSFERYKGGTYEMTTDSDVALAPYGMVGPHVTGVSMIGPICAIHTRCNCGPGYISAMRRERRS